MFTVIGLFKRRPGMSMHDFIDYYENHHAKLGARYLPTALEYKRRYLHPAPYPLDGTLVQPEYDVLTEMTFADRAAYDQAFQTLADPEIIGALTEDEERLFDRSKCRLVFVEEHCSEITNGRKA